MILNQELLSDTIMPDLSTKLGQQQLKSLTDQTKLIIVDNISTLCRTGDENKAEDWMIVQQWALRMRAEGRSVLFIHHTGKSGKQRGTAKREDILDTVISLQHPADYNSEKGALFEVHFEKARGMIGDDVAPFVAQKTEDSWLLQDLEDSTYDKVVNLYKHKLNQTEIATELSINKSTVSRHIKQAKSKGAIN